MVEFEIERVTKEEAIVIIEKREPLGLFYFIDGNIYVGIDNRSWDAWTEEFANLDDCLNWLRNEAVILCTFPDDENDYCKMFRVSKDWLLDLLEHLDDMNNREGVDLEKFLEEYVWDETYFIYIEAKEHEVLLGEKVQN